METVIGKEGLPGWTGRCVTRFLPSILERSELSSAGDRLFDDPDLWLANEGVLGDVFSSRPERCPPSLHRLTWKLTHPWEGSARQARQ